MEIIFGVDPGTRYTGYSVIEENNGRISLNSYGLIDNSKEKIFNKRLINIFRSITILLKDVYPMKLVIEDVPYARNFNATGKMLQVKGVIVLAALLKNIDVIPFFPTTVKRVIADNGKAKKDEVQRAVSKFFNSDFSHEKDDITDAIAIGMCYFLKEKSDERRETDRKKHRKNKRKSKRK